MLALSFIALFFAFDLFSGLAAGILIGAVFSRLFTVPADHPAEALPVLDDPIKEHDV